MKKFTYVEDYLEILNGDRDPNTGRPLGIFNTTPPIIQLARYDVKVLDSMSQSTLAGTGLTDKQADLACKIILKYRKQLAAQQIDVSPVETPQYRISIREINRSCEIYIADELICVKFPYQQKLVEEFKTTAKGSEGRALWNRDLRLWQLAITEFNVNWSYTFARGNNFTIDPAIQSLMDKIIECEQSPYEIKLTEHNGQITITNAEPELVNYINTSIGPIDDNNLLQLIDNSSLLGYTVDPIFEESVINKTSPRIYNLMVNRDSKFEGQDVGEIFKEILQYAEHSDRWPVYVYEPSLSGNLLRLSQEVLGKENVHEVKNKILPNFNETGSQIIVYFSKYLSLWDARIPLLISSQGMLYGGDKQMLLNRAEKIVYLTQEVYNNSSRGAKSIAG